MKDLIGLCVVITVCGSVCADDRVDYERDIKPIFRLKCVSCHGALTQESGLRLDAGVLIQKGSEGGPVVIPGRSADSPLMHRVSTDDSDERMPPEGEGEPLNAKQVDLLRAWIDAGAAIPNEEVVPEDPRQHWAYQPPKRSPLPGTGTSEWSHPIDAFIAAEHQLRGLQPVGMADRHTLLRRVYLDLIGLPPARHQIRDFIDDDSPAAWETVVDGLLKSPHYGERWGRHWMDIWRYSDWDGFKQELRGSQRHIWRWRDWIVGSLNADKGYDRMIGEMLAADEIAPDDPDVLPATGFLARNFHKSNRNIWLDATVEHTAKAFLGMTLNCARCHDHKYDPLPQQEYYRFRAIFEPHQVRTDRLPDQPNVIQDGLPRAFDSELSAETFLYIRGNEKHPDKDNPLSPAVPAVLGGQFAVEPVDLPLLAYYPALMPFAIDEDLALARQQFVAAIKELADAREKTAGAVDNSHDGQQPDIERLELIRTVAELRVQSLESRLAADRAKYRVDISAGDETRTNELALMAARVEREFTVGHSELAVIERKVALQAAETIAETTDEENKKNKTASIAARNALAAAEKDLAAAREALQETDTRYTPLGTEYPRTSSGRRAALARWIASSDNPLTARVAVNQIWMRHFGAPLVENVFDFGLRSPRPQHIQLLDWLAVELMENNWSMKHLHRLIVTSRTWRLSSSAVAKSEFASRNLDRDNQWLWRANVRRLDAEIVRDSVLAVAGQLDPVMGGAEIAFEQGENSNRRSIYMQHAYEKQMTMLVLFDVASPNDCYQRSESIIPQQALALINSSLTLTRSRLLARQLSEELIHRNENTPADFIREAFLQILSRPPASEEVAACEQFLADQSATLSDLSGLTTFPGGAEPKILPAADPNDRARENLIHVLMNHNDFITIR